MTSISHLAQSPPSPGFNHSPQAYDTSPCIQGSPSIRKRIKSSFRRRSHRDSDCTDEKKGSPSLHRRKSIVSLFGSFSSMAQRKSEQGIALNESPLKNANPTSPRNSDSVDRSPPLAVQRRKSLSSIIGSISQKVSPKRVAVFRKCPSYHENPINPKNDNNAMIAQTVSSVLTKAPPLPPQSSLNTRYEDISLADLLTNVADDIKDEQLGLPQSSMGSSSTLATQTLPLPITATIQNERTGEYDLPKDRIDLPNPAPDRKDTPDSCLKLLVASHRPTMNSSSTLTDGRCTPDSYLQLLIESQTLILDKSNLMQDNQRASPESPTVCDTAELVDSIKNVFNENASSENWSEDKLKPRSSNEYMSEPDFEKDQNSFWDAVMMGGEILYQKSNSRQKLRSFPSHETILSTLLVHKNIKKISCDNKKRPSKRSQYELRDSTSPNRHKPPSVLSGRTHELETQVSDESERRILREYSQSSRFPETCPFPGFDVLMAISLEETSSHGESHLSKPYPLCREIIEQTLMGYRSLDPIPVTLKQDNTSKYDSHQSCFLGSSPAVGIQVEYPDTTRNITHDRKCDWKVELITELLNCGYCMLSEYGIFDPRKRINHDPLLEAEHLGSDDIKQHGVEASELPAHSKCSECFQKTNCETASVKKAMTIEGSESPTPPSPSKRAEEALGSYLSIKDVSYANGLSSLNASDLSPLIPEEDGVESIMNDDFFLEGESELTGASLSNSYFDQPCSLSLVDIAINKEKISRPSSESELLFWGDEEDNVCSTPTYAQRRAHPKKMSARRAGRLDVSKQSNTKESNSNEDRPGLSYRLSSYEGDFCNPTSFDISESLLPEELDWLNGNPGEECRQKIYASEQDVGHKLSRHCLKSEIVEPDFRSTQFTKRKDHALVRCKISKSECADNPEILESVSLERVAESYACPSKLNTPEDTEIQINRMGLESVSGRSGEIMLPRLSTMNGRDYTLEIPEKETFSWSSFLNGNVEGLFPFYGYQRKLRSDVIDTLDTSISSLLGDSINHLPLRYESSNAADAKHSSASQCNTKEISRPKEDSYTETNKSSSISNILCEKNASNLKFELRKRGSGYNSGFEVDEYSTFHKSDPTFAPFSSEIVDSDVYASMGSHVIMEDPIVDKSSEALGSSGATSSFKWKFSEDNNQPRFGTGFGHSRKSSGDNSHVTRSEQSSDAIFVLEDISECSYGSLGAISMRSGFKFSEYGDLFGPSAEKYPQRSHRSSFNLASGFRLSQHKESLLDDADKALVEAWDQKSHTHDSTSPYSPTPVIPKVTAGELNPAVSLVDGQQYFPASETLDTCILFGDIPERHVSPNENILFPAYATPDVLQPRVRNSNLAGHLVGILEARGSLNSEFGSSRACNGISLPSKTRAVSPPLQFPSNMSDLDTDASLIGEPLERIS